MSEHGARGLAGHSCFRRARARANAIPRKGPAAIVWPVLVALALGVGCSASAAGDAEDAENARASFESQGRDTVVGVATSALVGAAPRRTRTAAAMLFDIGGAPNQASVMNLLSGPGTSLTRMYNEISYGLQQVKVDIYGPYTLPVKNCLTIACCGPSSDRTGNGPTVQGFVDALPAKYDHYFWDYGAIPAGANCGTWGDEGAPTRPAVYSSYSFQGIVGQAQELGHNLGMSHEPTMTCTGAKTFLDDPSQCTHVEYGSTLSFMGGGAHHPSAYHKYAQGWIGGCNVVKVGTSGTFNLVPQELPCGGAQLLQIAAPKTRAAPAAGNRQGSAPVLSNYYLEMRAPVGFDSGLKPMVVVSIGANLPTPSAPAPYLYVLDLVPESGRVDLTNAGLMTVGQSYTDPAGGLTITLTAIGPTGATVDVTTTAAGSNTCVDASSFTAPGPDGTSCGPLASSTDGGVASTGGASGAGTGGAAGRSGGAGGNVGTGNGSGGVGARGTGGATMGAGGRLGQAGTGGAIGAGTGGRAVGTGGDLGSGGGTDSMPGVASGGTGVASGGHVGSGGAGAGIAGTAGGSGASSEPPGAGGVGAPGCSCDSAGTSPTRAPAVALLLAAIVMRSRRSRRAAKKPANSLALARASSSR
jgi:MYXO-CTERM domain-containing protein